MLDRRLLAATFLAALAGHSAGSWAQDGYFDPAWGENGRRLIYVADVGGLGDGSDVLLPYPDGRMLMLGSCYWPGSPDIAFCATRLHPDGEYDLSFAQTGRITFSALPTRDLSVAGALLPNGGAIIAGGRDDVAAPGQVQVARLTQAGQLDTTAGNGQGFFAFRFHTPAASGPFVNRLMSVAVQPDGKIVVTGSTRTMRNGVANDDMAVARILADLSGLDTGFGGGDGVSPPGVKLVAFDFNSPDVAYNDDVGEALLLQPDGGIVVAGSGYSRSPFDGYRPAAFRLLGNGQLDTSFADNGRWSLTVVQGVSRTVHALTSDRLGRLLMAGSSAGADPGFLVVRLQSDGSASYRTIGFAPVAISHAYANAIAVQSDGRIILAGAGWANGNQDRRFLTARLRENLDLDASYGSQGLSYGVFSGPVVGDHAAESVAIANGGVMVAGWGQPDVGQPTRFGLARLRLDLIFVDGFQP